MKTARHRLGCKSICFSGIPNGVRYITEKDAMDLINKFSKQVQDASLEAGFQCGEDKEAGILRPGEAYRLAREMANERRREILFGFKKKGKK